MARTVEDLALFLDAMSGYDPSWPISFPAPRTPFLTSVRAGGTLPRIAWAATLGGFAPCEADVREVLESALRAGEGQGAVVEEACPDLPDLYRTYITLRAINWTVGPGRLPKDVQKHFKKTLADNIALGQGTSIDDLGDAQIARTVLYHNTRKFLDTYDVLAFPVVGLSPQAVEVEYPTEVDGQPMAHYVDWLRFSYLATVTGLPALSLPAGRTPDGMPMGIQLLGRPRGEARLLQVARFLERAIGRDPTPFDPVVRH
jgi:amidase